MLSHKRPQAFLTVHFQFSCTLQYTTPVLLFSYFISFSFIFQLESFIDYYWKCVCYERAFTQRSNLINTFKKKTPYIRETKIPKIAAFFR